MLGHPDRPAPQALLLAAELAVTLRLSQLPEVLVHLDLEAELGGDRRRRLARASQRTGPQSVDPEFAEVPGRLGGLRSPTVGEPVADIVGQVAPRLGVRDGFAVADEMGDQARAGYWETQASGSSVRAVTCFGSLPLIRWAIVTSSSTLRMLARSATQTSWSGSASPSYSSVSGRLERT